MSINGEYFIADQEYTNGSTRLTHERASTMEALDHIAVPSEETSTAVRATIEQGSIKLVDRRLPEFEREDPIKHDNEIYYVTHKSYRSNSVEEIIPRRIFLWLLGSALIYSAWERRGRTS